MNAKLPVIGLTFGAVPDKDTDPEYCNAIINAGGEVLILRPNNKESFNLLPSLEGLMLTGGPDVHPKQYGEEVKYRSVHVDEERDEFEVKIIKYCLDNNIPVLGICRGIQILNVACGGTLYQDLRSDIAGHLEDAHGCYNGCKDKIEKRRLRHKINITSSSSRLKDIMDSSSFLVNTRHHQAVKDVAGGFDVVASSSDGVIEAIENQKFTWVVGVQWHPESKEVHEQFQPLFNAFVAAAKGDK